MKTLCMGYVHGACVIIEAGFLLVAELIYSDSRVYYIFNFYLNHSIFKKNKGAFFLLIVRYGFDGQLSILQLHGFDANFLAFDCRTDYLLIEIKINFKWLAVRIYICFDMTWFRLAYLIVASLQACLTLKSF